jgi:hypothetical protein
LLSKLHFYLLLDLKTPIWKRDASRDYCVFDIICSFGDTNMKNPKIYTEEHNNNDIESQLLQLNETVSNIQQELDDERRMLQSGRLGIGIVIMSITIILGLTILYYCSLLTTVTSTLIHGACLAAIGLVIALLCTVLPKNKKSR